MQQARAARGRMEAGIAHDHGQVFARDIERFAEMFQRGVDVLGRHGRRRRRALVHMVRARHPVIQQRRQHQQHRVQADRRQRETQAKLMHFRSAQHRRHGYRPTWRMQTAQQEHHGDRQTTGQRRGEHGIR